MKGKNALRWITCLALAGAMSGVAMAAGYTDKSLEERIAILEAQMLEEKEDTEAMTLMEKEVNAWTINGYGRSTLRASKSNDWNTSDIEPHVDNFLGRLGKESETNYLELVAKRRFEGKNGSWAELNLRTEYGNDYALADSSVPDGDDDSTQFELKEMFVEMGGLDILPTDSTIWAGRRYYKRNAGPFTDDYFVQSSAVGIGYDAPAWAIAFMGVDSDEDTTDNKIDDGKSSHNTIYVLDTRLEGIEGWEFQANFYFDGNDEKVAPTDAETGYALRATKFHNSFYGSGVGWSQTSLIYGAGLAGGAAGTNFGEWVPSQIDKDAKMYRLASYGQVDINDIWSLGAEFNFQAGNEENPWVTDGNKWGFVLRPQQAITDHFKMVYELTYGDRDINADWNGYENYSAWAITIAPTFTIDSGFWGRPEIRTFVSYINNDASIAATDSNNIKTGEYNDIFNGSDYEILVGTQVEFWF